MQAGHRGPVRGAGSGAEGWVMAMAGKRVLVIGGNFGGLTAALELKYELGEDADITVVSASDRFLFNPSLIWLPFGKRSAGNNGVMILADHMLPPRKAAVMIPGPQTHAMKVAFEKYYLWKSRHGYVRLP
jgi:hypothetical protein